MQQLTVVNALIWTWAQVPLAAVPLHLQPGAPVQRQSCGALLSATR